MHMTTNTDMDLDTDTDINIDVDFDIDLEQTIYTKVEFIESIKTLKMKYKHSTVKMTVKI